MKIFTKAGLLTGTFYCSTLFAQAQKIQTPPLPADQRMTWQSLRKPGNDETTPAYYPRFKSTIATTANASAGTIIDEKDVRVFPSPNVQSEVHISINHNNPKNLIASANTLLGADKGRHIYNQGYYFSFDGGYSWSGADFLQTAPINNVAGDPSTGIAENGTAIITTINFSQELFDYGYLFQKSNNGGNTWSDAVEGINYHTNFGFDKQMMAVDNGAESPYKNYFYDAYTDFSIGGGAVVFNRSKDLGQTFSTPIIIRNQVTGFGQGTNVQTGPNGEVYVCWADHNEVQFPYRADALGFNRSLNGGVSFGTSRRVFTYNGTRTFGIDSTYNYVRVADFPSMAVDKSTGKYRGRIYVTYPTLSSNDKSIIEVRWSDDKGNTWSDPVEVGIKKSTQNFFPWIATDDVNGDVWVVYFAFDTKTKFETNTYVALSTDGGTTWENQKVSDVSHITEPINNKLFALGYAGDYIGITAYNKKAYPTWQDQRNGTWQLYVSPVSRKNVEAKPVSRSDYLKVSPNPFNSSIIVTLEKGDANKIELINQSGIVIKQWQNALSKNLNVADVPKGVYLLKVTGKDNVYTQKILKE